jgi:lipopolysaccharide cholinephosphotransferase
MKKEDLNKIKQVEMEVMDYIAKICKKYDITYYLYFGSLLGAIRHKGFIPWDDDIDIVMKPEDYIKFLDVMKNEENDIYYLQNIENTKYYSCIFSKIRKYHTTMVEEEFNYLPYKKGINVDIFPMYRYPKNKLSRMKFMYRYKTVSLLLNRDIKLHGIKGKIINMLLHLIPRSLVNKKIIRKHNKMLKYNKDFNEYFVDDHHFDKNWFDKLEVPFEDRKYIIPKEYDKILTVQFGDYMTPPPKEEQVGHGGGKIVLSFTKEYDEM